MSELPKGWAHIAFECILDQIVGGGTPSKANTSYFQGTIPFMTVKDMTTRFPLDTVDHISEDAVKSSATTLVRKDTLIIATRMSLGKIVRPKFDTAINQDLKALFLRENIDKTYVEYFWRSKAQHIQDLGTGTTVKGIRLEDIRSLNISLAPSEEQKRIADKLDTVLVRVDACRERLNRVPLILKRFRQSVLAAATSGKLTEDWRQVNKVEIFFESDDICQSSKFHTVYLRERLSKIADARLGKMLDKTKNTGSLRPYIGNINVRWFCFDLENLQEIRIEDKEIANLSLRRGDVLICEGGEPGRCAIWNRDNTDIVFQKALHRVRTKPDILLPQWLAFCMKFFAESGGLNDLFTGTTIKHLTGASLSKLEFPLPNIVEQTEIVRRVETLFAFADRLEARLASASAAADKLTPALLAKAFRGELVPQDPNDEPAAALLQRLAQAKTSEAGKAGQVKKTRAKHGAVLKPE